MIWEIRNLTFRGLKFDTPSRHPNGVRHLSQEFRVDVGQGHKFRSHGDMGGILSHGAGWAHLDSVRRGERWPRLKPPGPHWGSMSGKGGGSIERDRMGGRSGRPPRLENKSKRSQLDYISIHRGQFSTHGMDDMYISSYIIISSHIYIYIIDLYHLYIRMIYKSEGSSLYTDIERFPSYELTCWHLKKYCLHDKAKCMTLFFKEKPQGVLYREK